MQTSLFPTDSLFYRFFHHSPVGMVATADGRYADVNAAYAQMLGYTREELIGQEFRVMGFSDEEVRQMVINYLIQIRKIGDIPLILETRDGRKLTCIASTQLEEIDGKSYLFSIIQDLTEHEAAQEALRQSENRFRLFFRSMPLPLLVIDEETHRILEVNPAAVKLYGYSTDEFSALTMRDLIPAEDWPYFAQAFNSSDPPSAAPSIICRQILKDGSIIEVEVTSNSFEMDGQCTNLSIIREVTEERKMQVALEASQDRLRIIADVTTDAIWSRDLLTDEVEWSSGLSSLFGYFDEGNMNHDWWASHVHPDERQAVEHSIEAAFASLDDTWKAEYQFLQADGSYAKVLDRGHITRDEDGRPTHFLGAMVDITEQLQVAEAASRAAEEERQRLARDLHESVTQSLYSLSLMAEAARRRWSESSGEVTTDYIARLGELSRHALRQLRLLVYELRPTQLEQVGLAAALRHRLEAVEQRAGIRFRLDDECATPIPPTLQGELFRLAQDALNFSLRYAQATAVRVRLWSDQEQLYIEIEDDGRGNGSETSGRAADLAAIQNRVEALGGALSMFTSDAGTTVLRAGIPIAISMMVAAR